MKVDIRRIGQDPLVVEVDDAIAGCVYIHINGRVYYIDDSTNEQIVSRWAECACTGICYCDHEAYDLVPVEESSEPLWRSLYV
jgi:hypothetical protein